MALPLENKSTEKKTGEEEKKDEDDLSEIIEQLKLDFHKLGKAIDFNSENVRRLAILINARQRIAMSVFAGTSMMRDPKLRLMTNAGRRRDLARMIERALLKNNPAANKMAQDANRREEVSAKETTSPKKEDDESQQQQEASSTVT